MIICTHFSSVLDRAAKGDFVYFDPPYHPVSKTASFTSYDSSGFAKTDQKWLASVYSELSSRGVCAMLSNSDTAFTRRLYGGFRPERVWAARSVSRNGSGRGRVSELLVTNYSTDSALQPRLLETPGARPRRGGHSSKRSAKRDRGSEASHT